MIVVKKECEFDASIDQIWDLMTNLDNQMWRKSVEKIEKIGFHRFIEHDRSGIQTEFYIVNMIEKEVYEMNLKNDNLEGHWIGKLKERNGKVHLEMIEAIQVKKGMMKILAKRYLKHQQKQYIRDLKNAFNNN